MKTFISEITLKMDKRKEMKQHLEYCTTPDCRGFTVTVFHKNMSDQGDIEKEREMRSRAIAFRLSSALKLYHSKQFTEIAI
jgi:hypothetical protein